MLKIERFQCHQRLILMRVISHRNRRVLGLVHSVFQIAAVSKRHEHLFHLHKHNSHIPLQLNNHTPPSPPNHHCHYLLQRGCVQPVALHPHPLALRVKSVQKRGNVRK